MVKRRGVDGPPVTYLVSGEWPDGDVDGPVFAVYAQGFVQRLISVMGNRSVREVAAAADLHHTTLLALLDGEAWPDLVTIAKLENALDADLWPGRSGRQEGQDQ